MVNPKEQKSRKIAIWVIGLMVIVWTVLGVLSFVETENRKRPHTVNITFAGQNALTGKQVFQAYNCMDCHTIVGNGAYFAPDLTKIYEQTGPAWLLAYLGSPGAYPTEAVVNIQLNELIKNGEASVKGIGNLDDYYSEYPKAKERVDERGGVDALMPNLKFSKDEIDGLVAFLKYTSEINTAGWPPEVFAKQTVIDEAKKHLEAKSGLPVKTAVATASGDAGGDATAPSGEEVANAMGCMACHSTDGSVKIGPSWKKLYGEPVALSDGSSVTVDDEYLKNSILKPNDQIVKGFQPGLMPSYDGIVSEQDMDAIIEYIKSIK
ncbi:MAG: c-type cytochrome [Flavobacteriia bacterium]|nr:c-type cytochrome [Flavobacteriia bacterium]